MSDIEIEIDGRTLKAAPNTMLIQVADAAGIYIPRFCYHKHLTVAANCRMCLVEVEKAPKPLPACATPVAPGMKVHTRSAIALAAQKAVMEFLLINHPLDCPICDQGGECELQDLSLGYGASESYYSEGKRTVKDKDIGPLIATDMTRCIQCTRCVRFGDEIAGMRELGATGRGEHMEIGTYVQHAMHSEVSGNIIDLCPVGALTSKPFRFTARAWELEQFPTIAPHDCMGSNINVHTRYGKVMRVVPRENDQINETWISDRDRYSYEGLYHPDRLMKPLIRQKDKWQETDWQTALTTVVERLQAVIRKSGADGLGALISPNSTLEEFYLLQKIMRALGSHHIDHRLRQTDFNAENTMPLAPGIAMSFEELEKCDVILIIGSHLTKEVPSLALRLRKAFRQGAKIMAVNMMDHAFYFPLTAKKIVAPHDFVASIAGIAKACSPNHDKLSHITMNEVDIDIVQQLRQGHKVAILFGTMASLHPEASLVQFYADWIAKQCGIHISFLTEGCNAAGAWSAGAVPHRTVAGVQVSNGGLNAKQMLLQPRNAYILCNVEPEFDCGSPVTAQNAFEQAECVIALSMFRNASLEQYADVILPIAPYTETAGTFVNAVGTWQTFQGTAASFGESRPAWKVLRALANFLQLEGFQYESAEEVLHEIKLKIDESAITTVVPRDVPTVDQTVMQKGEGLLTRIGEIPIYCGDSLLRRSKALQATLPIMEGELGAVRLHPETAKKLGTKEGETVFVKQLEQRVRLPVILDKKVPLQAAYIAGATRAANRLNELFGPVEVYK